MSFKIFYEGSEYHGGYTPRWRSSHDSYTRNRASDERSEDRLSKLPIQNALDNLYMGYINLDSTLSKEQKSEMYYFAAKYLKNLDNINIKNLDKYYKDIKEKFSEGK